MYGIRSVALLLALVALATAPSAAAAQPRCDAPRVLLVVDRSSSMVEPLTLTMTKWEAARLALREITSGFESTIDFGLMLFPAGLGCSPGRVSIDVGATTSDEIVHALGTPPPPDGFATPLQETLVAAAAYRPLTEGSRDSHLVLITDGAQWGCEGYDPARRFDPVFAVSDLRRLGVTVHIVGFGHNADALVLNRSAVAAGTEIPGCDPTLADVHAAGHCYHQADDLDGLRAALDAVARRVSEELCDGWDNDCNGETDELFDVDADGFTICGTVPETPGDLDDGLADCDDRAEAIHPGALEICDGLDNDCDGMRDPGCACIVGDTMPCGSDIGECVSGTFRCEDGAFTTRCEGERPPAAERCDGLDTDCDAVVDEGATDCGPDALCMGGGCVDIEEPPPPAADAGIPADEPGLPAPSTGGCGCATPGPTLTPAGPAPVVALVVLVLLGLVRRRF
jgi:hypothetical protein